MFHFKSKFSHATVMQRRLSLISFLLSLHFCLSFSFISPSIKSSTHSSSQQNVHQTFYYILNTATNSLQSTTSASIPYQASQEITTASMMIGIYTDFYLDCTHNVSTCEYSYLRYDYLLLSLLTIMYEKMMKK